jgi:hypothetical protein
VLKMGGSIPSSQNICKVLSIHEASWQCEGPDFLPAKRHVETQMLRLLGAMRLIGSVLPVFLCSAEEPGGKLKTELV